jgi:hypothetical protein
MKNILFKYVVLAIFSGLLLTSCENKKKESLGEEKTTTEKKDNWTSEAKQAFKDNSNAFLIAHSVDNPEKYTDCLLKTVMDKYPNPDEAMEIGQNELSDLFEKSSCIDDLVLVKIVSAWNAETEKIFLKNCINSAQKNAMIAKDAKSYCDCALGKIKKMIPNPQHVITLTEEEYKTILKECK